MYDYVFSYGSKYIFFHFCIGMANIGDFSKESLLNQAQNVWSMLDEMAESSPEKYKEFIDKQMKEAKEYMKPPEPNMCVQSSLQVLCTSL